MKKMGTIRKDSVKAMIWFINDCYNCIVKLTKICLFWDSYNRQFYISFIINTVMLSRTFELALKQKNLKLPI